MIHNQLTAVGRMTGDPELRFTKGGKAVANFTVAWNRKMGDEEVPAFLDCTCWEELAENVAGSLTKGTRVIVSGTLQQRWWENPEGERRAAWGLNVEDMGPEMHWAEVLVKPNEKKSKPKPEQQYEPATPAFNPDEEPF